MSNDIIKANEPVTSHLSHAKIEIETLMEQARFDKRNIAEFMDQAIQLATYSDEIAGSCIFSLPRKKKNEKTGKYEQTFIKGKSIRLAEIIFSVYKNIKVDTRIATIGAKSVTAIASAIDLQNKTFFSEEAIVDIKGSHGDATKLAIGAAKSIAIRNAIFRLVPGALSDEIYKKAVERAVGNQKTFPEKRKAVFERIAKLGIPHERLFAFYNKQTIEEFTPDNVEEIIGIGSAIKEGELKIDKAFVVEAISDDANEAIEELLTDSDSAPKVDVINADTGEVV